MPLISGKEVDEKGEPVAWARVMISRAPVEVQDIAMLTSDDGSFTLSVPANGSYEVLVASDDGGEAKAAVEVTGERNHVEMKVGG